MELTSEEGSLFWIRYMRYLRRTNQMAASRRLFLRARKWPPCGWQVRSHEHLPPCARGICMRKLSGWLRPCARAEPASCQD